MRAGADATILSSSKLVRRKGPKWLGGPHHLVPFSGFLTLTQVRALGGGRRRRWQHFPLDILKQRYAAGEITKEQYEQMRSDINSD